MTAKNQLVEAPPYAVDQAVKNLGRNLRTARLRRGLTIAEAAEKIGTNRRVVADAEKGKVTSAIAVYAALLWVYDLLSPFEELASPLKDEQGLALAARREPARARKAGGLDNDF
jgi:transcriptional regulator with XRE-family HTH domain